jgi:hypothetical protein
MLLALSRKTELYHAIRYWHSNYEHVFRHWRERYSVAGKDVSGRLRRSGVPAQRLRAAASLVLDWFRVDLRHGWLEPVALDVALNVAAPTRLSGRQDRHSGEVTEAGYGTERLGRVISERIETGTHLPYGNAWEQLQRQLEHANTR